MSAIVVFSKRGKIGESDHFYQIVRKAPGFTSANASWAAQRWRNHFHFFIAGKEEVSSSSAPFKLKSISRTHHGSYGLLATNHA